MRQRPSTWPITSRSLSASCYPARVGENIDDAGVDGGHGGGILLHPFAAKSEQAGNEVRMVVCEDDFVDAGEINLQVAGVRSDGVGMRARVEENAVAVRFDERREAPLAEGGWLSDEHGREHCDFEGVDLGCPIAGFRC